MSIPGKAGIGLYGLARNFMDHQRIVTVYSRFFIIILKVKKNDAVL